jgi:hypothetical protein
MVKAAPSAAFAVAEPNFLLKFETVAFDPTSHLQLPVDRDHRCRLIAIKMWTTPAR